MYRKASKPFAIATLVPRQNVIVGEELWYAKIPSGYHSGWLSYVSVSAS